MVLRSCTMLFDISLGMRMLPSIVLSSGIRVLFSNTREMFLAEFSASFFVQMNIVAIKLVKIIVVNSAINSVQYRVDMQLFEKLLLVIVVVVVVSDAVV